MTIKNLLLNFTHFADGEKNGKNGVLSPKQLRSVIERERARADRNGHVFSLIIFDVGQNQSADHRLDTFISLLTKRLRETDVLGWFNQLGLGVFLPDTAEKGAVKLAASINDDMTGRGKSYKIYTYPDDWFFPNHPPAGKNSKQPQTQQLPEGVENGNNSNGSGDRQFAALNTNSDDNIFLYPMPFWKRLFDIFISFVSLILLSPLFIVIALIIKIVSPGPVFFKQERLGYQGKPFILWKFRTMAVDAPTDIHEKLMRDIISSNNGKQMQKLDAKNDPRIIPFGNFLRHSCLDELPQLFNVLRGDMSIIGPRPCMPYEADNYKLWHTRRFDLTPGMTGLWQVNGKNKTTFKEMIRYDIRYKKQRYFLNDIKILSKTFPAIINFVRDDLIAKRKSKKAA